MTPGVDYIKADVVDIGYCQNWCKNKGYAFSGVQYYNGSSADACASF